MSLIATFPINSQMRNNIAIQLYLSTGVLVNLEKEFRYKFLHRYSSNTTEIITISLHSGNKSSANMLSRIYDN